MYTNHSPGKFNRRERVESAVSRGTIARKKHADKRQEFYCVVSCCSYEQRRNPRHSYEALTPALLEQHPVSSRAMGIVTVKATHTRHATLLGRFSYPASRAPRRVARYSPGCLIRMASLAIARNDSQTSRDSVRLFDSIVLRNIVLLKNLIWAAAPGTQKPTSAV